MLLLGELSALLTACCWSGSALSFAAAIRRAGSVRVNVTRLLIATVFLAITMLVARLDVQLSSSQVWYLVLSGIIGLVFGDTFLFKSYEYNGARLSSLIMSIAPALSAILAYLFLGELVSLAGVVGMIVTMAGIGIVVLERRASPTSQHPFSPVGVFYGFLAAAGQGAGLVAAKIALNEGPINGFVATFVRITSSVVILLPIAVLAGRYKNPIRTFLEDRKTLGLTILGSVLGPYLGITLSLIAITYTKVGIAATLMATVPIIMLPLSKYMQKEVLSWKSILGAFVAVVGVAILFLR